jgi:hypothetical protein
MMLPAKKSVITFFYLISCLFLKFSLSFFYFLFFLYNNFLITLVLIVGTKTKIKSIKIRYCNNFFIEIRAHI